MHVTTDNANEHADTTSVITVLTLFLNKITFHQNE